MRRSRLPTYFGVVSLTMFLITSLSTRQVLHAQTAPAAGTRVVVKMIDTVDSASDSAGKQYRASVTAEVDAGNGVTIARGSAATVTLTSSGSSYTVQLSSVTINGQVVAVTSSSATVSALAQNVQARTTSAVTSVLGGFVHHVNAPASVATAAMGQHVFLPTGTTLTFVLGASPASSPVASATSTGNAAQPPAPSAANPAPTHASGPATTSSNGASGQLNAMEVCFATPRDPTSGQGTMYLTAAFEVPLNTQGAIPTTQGVQIPVFEPAFSAYLKATYQYTGGITCHPIWSIHDAQGEQKRLADDRDRGKLKVINTGWRYGQPPLAPGQSGFDPIAQGPSGIDLSQHRLTTYFCSLTADGGTTMAVDTRKPNWNANMTTYVSQVFQADWDSAPVSMAYNVFIRDHYVHDLTLSDLSPRCGAQSPAMQTMAHQTAMISNKRIGQAVAVDFSYTPAQQAAATHALGAPATPATASASTGGPFISCSTQGGGGMVIYLTGIFQTSKPVKHLPNGAKIVDQSVLDDFYAYLTQKGYTFKPGSNGGCDVSPTEAAAITAQHTRVYGGNGSCGYCGNKVVETGWKDTP